MDIYNVLGFDKNNRRVVKAESVPESKVDETVKIFEAMKGIVRVSTQKIASRKTKYSIKGKAKDGKLVAKIPSVSADKVEWAVDYVRSLKDVHTVYKNGKIVK